VNDHTAFHFLYEHVVYILFMFSLPETVMLLVLTI